MNIIKYIIILAIVLNISSIIFSKEDTLSTALPDIRVTADRILSEQSLKYNSYNIISKAEITQKNPWQTYEILNSVPGIFINDYGGLGGLKTISMRGTSSSQSLLMIDGMRFNSSQSAVADLSIIPVSIFDELEVVRGGSSAIFGGNAIGGVVNIRTSDFDKNKFSLSLNAGSFDEYFISAKSIFGNENLNQLVSAEYKTSEGSYPFLSGETKKKYYRNNSDFTMYSATSLTRYKFGTWNLSNRMMLNFSDRNIPGPFIENIENNTLSPKLTDKSALFLISAVNKLNHSSSLFMGINANINSYKYTDENFYGNGYPEFKSEFTNKDLMLNVKYNSIFSIFNYSLGIETGYSNLTGNQLDYSVDENVDRYLIAISGKIESELSIKPIGDIDYSFGVRYDSYSDAGNALSAFFGLLYDFQRIPLQVKGQVSNNFRPPSFNEMYYLNFGNKDLKPEKSLSFNLGMTYNPFNFINFQVDGFYINTDDRIVSVPKSQASWSAENISEVTSNGLEFSSDMNFFKNLLNLNLSYTFQDVRNTAIDDNNYKKLIVYMPQEILSASMILKYAGIYFGTTLRYSGHYFSLPDNSYESMMNGYSIIDVFISYNMKLSNIEMNLRAECKNLLDEQYSIIVNYPMPGRLFRVGVSTNI
ncbi:MAG: TonB-dependent receptor [bacterium]